MTPEASTELLPGPPSKVTIPELWVNTGEPDLVKLVEIVKLPEALGAVKVPPERLKWRLTSKVTAPAVHAQVPAPRVMVAVVMLTL